MVIFFSTVFREYNIHCSQLIDSVCEKFINDVFGMYLTSPCTSSSSLFCKICHLLSCLFWGMCLNSLLACVCGIKLFQILIILLCTSQLCTLWHFTWQGLTHLAALHPCFLPLPSHVCQISPGPNYDYYSSTMRFTISSPVV